MNVCLGDFTDMKCRKCGAICAVGMINPKTLLCTECDKEHEPAEWCGGWIGS